MAIPILLLVVTSQAATAFPMLQTEEIPPVGKWVKVKDVGAEYAYIDNRPCKCGGTWKVDRQATGAEDDAKWDRLFCKCPRCGATAVFTFNITGWMKSLKHAGSESAKREAWAALDNKYPSIKPKLAPELIKLLCDPEVHKRTWAVAALVKIRTDEARRAVLDQFLKGDIMIDMNVHFACQEAMGQMGAAMVPLIEGKMSSVSSMKQFELVTVLGKIRDPSARKAIEAELDGAALRLRRACYIALGHLGYKESEPILMKELARNDQNPDDALVWALGRCGTQKSVADLRQLAKSGDEKVRLAAIGALGNVGDRESISELLKMLEDSDFNVRHNAVYALAQLHANEAVPRIIDALNKPAPSTGATSARGIYDDGLPMVSIGNLDRICIYALGRIGDRRAVPAFRMLLESDRAKRLDQEVAKAAVEAGWKELVPDLIHTFQLSHAYMKSLYKEGEPPERMSPHLRKLTGESFGENPEEWAGWLGRKPSSNKSCR